ncbi:MAG: DUF4236 domain-containing protein [Verrucomicrobium sp.]|nr:DUF4236 domain-containing protein [Verrucomicrobium sp.]
MGFTFRKSVRVGPFRFNLSTSGSGFSTGIKGLRVGTGPRGTYISMGAEGFQYRTYLPSSTRPNRIAVDPSRKTPSDYAGSYSHALQMAEARRVDMAALQDASSIQLLNELNERARRISWVKTLWLWVALILGGAGITAIFYPESSVPKPLVTAILWMFIPAWIGAYYVDLSRLEAVLMFDLSDQAAANYHALRQALETVSRCKEFQYIRARGRIDMPERKYHAGASAELDTRSVSFGFSLPPRIKANVTPYRLSTEQIDYYFFPDRILIRSNETYGAVLFDSLELEADLRRIIVRRAPADGKIVDRTWRYVNKGGGPDRRFSYNPELPVVEYSTLHITSGYGLDETLCFSQFIAAGYLKQALDTFKQALQVLRENERKRVARLAEQEAQTIEAKSQVQRMVANADPGVYLGFGQASYGPYEKPVIAEWVRLNQLQEGTLFWDSANQQWRPIAEFNS